MTLADLARTLEIPFWNERYSGKTIILIAGSRGSIRAAQDALIVTLRSKAAGAVQGVLRELVHAGLLAVDRDGPRLARMPDAVEVAKVRELLGLQRYLPA
jgi:hypothetical protein